MRDELRQQVQRRYSFRCGYCGVRETDACSKLTVDHFQPRAQGGDDSLDNLVYCCHACNEFKGDYWRTEANKRLLHPISDDQTEHIQEQTDGTLNALTERSANHIQVLHLNRVELIEGRFERQGIATIKAYCQTLEARVLALEETFRTDQAEISKKFGIPDQ